MIIKEPLRAAWINPRFLHYRLPVYKALDNLLDANLTVIYSKDRTPESVHSEIQAILGTRAIALRGEKRMNFGMRDGNFANEGYSIPYQPGLLRAIKNAQPDVIISEGFFQWTRSALLLKYLKRIPLIISYERTKHTERNAGTWRTLYRRFIGSQIDAVCCNGRLSREYCNEVIGIPPDRIVTGGMAADITLLSCQCAGLEDNMIESTKKRLGLIPPVFLYLGRLVRPKGLRELMGGWDTHTKRSGNDSGTLLLVGDGPEKLALETIIRKKRISRVIFTGRADYKDVALYYKISDIFIMPTLEDNWSLVVPEAMACGLPILCSRYNGCWPELVHSDINGWVFDPVDIEEIAYLMNICCEKRKDLLKMGEASREIVQRFSPDKAAEAFYKTCLTALNK